jgi:hypothetical protein
MDFTCNGFAFIAAMPFTAAFAAEIVVKYGMPWVSVVRLME